MRCLHYCSLNIVQLASRGGGRGTPIVTSLVRCTGTFSCSYHQHNARMVAINHAGTGCWCRVWCNRHSLNRSSWSSSKPTIIMIPVRPAQARGAADGPFRRSTATSYTGARRSLWLRLHPRRFLLDHPPPLFSEHGTSVFIVGLEEVRLVSVCQLGLPVTSCVLFVGLLFLFLTHNARSQHPFVKLALEAAGFASGSRCWLQQTRAAVISSARWKR